MCLCLEYTRLYQSCQTHRYYFLYRDQKYFEKCDAYRQSARKAYRSFVLMNRSIMPSLAGVSGLYGGFLSAFRVSRNSLMRVARSLMDFSLLFGLSLRDWRRVERDDWSDFIGAKILLLILSCKFQCLTLRCVFAFRVFLLVWRRHRLDFSCLLSILGRYGRGLSFSIPLVPCLPSFLEASWCCCDSRHTSRSLCTNSTCRTSHTACRSGEHCRTT
jgi:hypothetical protein